VMRMDRLQDSWLITHLVHDDDRKPNLIVRYIRYSTIWPLILSLVHGNELSGSSGSIESPLYSLPNHVLGRYSWRVFVNQSQAIQITFTDFDFEHDTTGESCTNYLKVCQRSDSILYFKIHTFYQTLWAE
jgi:hypothetical protein